MLNFSELKKLLINYYLEQCQTSNEKIIIQVHEQKKNTEA